MKGVFQLIKNAGELLDVGDPLCRKARHMTLQLLEEGLKAADPYISVKRAIKMTQDSLEILDFRIELDGIDNVYVVGAGKACGGMAKALEEVLNDRISKGIVIIPKGTPKPRVSRIELVEGSHPIPSKENIRHAKRIMELVKEADSRDLVLCLISGGGSALLCLPREELSVDDVQELTRVLLKSGATIHEVNTIRKHVELLKGGKLARLAHPATVISLIISDVVGDDLDVIASGPTAPDKSTFKDAMDVLEKYGVKHEVPGKVLEIIERGVRGEIEENPKPGDDIFKKVYNFIVASNTISLEAMERRARELGLKPLVLTSYLEGEAREVGRVIASIARHLYHQGQPLDKPCVLLMGGETTVTLEEYGKGKGGRNQELVLSASMNIRRLKGIAIASIGTDGIDGNSDAAGAIVDWLTVDEAERRGLSPMHYLLKHDSYSFFKELGRSLIFTGPTGTNVNDLTVLIYV
ncbi:MAG: glycerate kinase [Thermoprotei archaeon]|nr:MAG: glycerate kinase [Thermoprotei archaeon]RLF24339.1 MAG: glycerate kinase [Thermoprotei archaeon]